MAYLNGKQILFSVQLHTSGGSGSDDEEVLNALAALYDVPIIGGEIVAPPVYA